MQRAAVALERDHEREALRILRPLRDDIPGAACVRELLGLALYRCGYYQAAAKELEELHRLTGSLDQHPVLMDCYRAQGRWRRVSTLWGELRRGSTRPEIAVEGRIVAAGALSDRDRLDDAVELLRRADRPKSSPAEHDLRLWYALADLEERSGNLPHARTLFDRIAAADPGFADAAERRTGL